MTDLAQAPAAEAPITEAPADDTPAPNPSETPPVAPEKTEAELLKEAHAKALQREQRRIDNITRRRYEAEAQAKAASDRVAELEAKLAQSTSAAQKPRLEDFKTIEDFAEAMADWKAGSRVDKAIQDLRQNELKGHEQRAQDEQHRAAHEAFQQALGTVEEAGKKAYADFTEVVSKAPNYGPMVGSLVLQTEKPAEISYYLAKNPDVGLSIRSMPAHQAAMAIARLESQFSSRRTTQAPPPPPEVGGNSTAKKWDPDDTSVSTGEWIRRMNKLKGGK